MSRDRQDSAARYVMKKKKKAKPGGRLIEAAGGIVMRGRVRPLFAIVQLRRQRTWVLPKGKLNRDETALAAARREAIEETGHDVTVHEFLGSLGYKSSGRPKIVKFWRMQASGRPVGKLMRDVRAVRWLSLAQATATLTHERERLFLEKVGRPAVRQAAGSKRAVRKTAASRRKKVRASRKRMRGVAGHRTKRHIDTRARKRRAPATASSVPVTRSVHLENTRSKPRTLVRKLWKWLRR
jgi:8-oxo-dGTP diphosphatase